MHFFIDGDSVPDKTEYIEASSVFFQNFRFFRNFRFFSKLPLTAYETK